MSVTININNLTLCHRGSGGITHNTLPDICKTPDKGIPRPFDNEAYSKDLANGTTSVFADGGNMIANFGSIFAKSGLDGGGSLGGIKSNTFLAEADFITHSFDVFFEGKGACRLTDKMWMNHRNTANMAGLKQYNIDPVVNIACNIFCEVLEKSRQPGAKKPFPFSEEAKNLAKTEFAEDLTKVGIKAEQSLWVRATQTVKTIIKDTGRKVYSNSSLLQALGRRVASISVKAGTEIVVATETGAEGGAVAGTIVEPGGGTVVGGGVGTVGGAVVGIGMATWTACDLWDVAKELGPLAKDILSGWGDAIKVRPDLTMFGEDGSIRKLFDFKFEGDTFRNKQKEIYEKIVGEDNVEVINGKTCNYCK
jgi:Domain of unknown function (DUF4150)